MYLRSVLQLSLNVIRIRLCLLKLDTLLLTLTQPLLFHGRIKRITILLNDSGRPIKTTDLAQNIVCFLFQL